VTPRTGKLGETLERLLPFLTLVSIVTAGWFWFIQPRRDLPSRAHGFGAPRGTGAHLQQASGRASPQPAAASGAPSASQERMSAEDTVADVAAALAQAVLANASRQNSARSSVRRPG
jgi:hypothetical protein